MTMRIITPILRNWIAVLATASLLAACADSGPVAPTRQAAVSAQLSKAEEREAAIHTMRRVTARYHNLRAAIEDDFVFLHGCETRGNEGPVGMLYVNIERLLDGVIDPALPDALIYEPRKNGRPELVGVELALPYAFWTNPEPPTFMGATFQPEDEFGVWGLHAWIWRKNPEGMFAESNPRVSCEG
jgi:hypothetical protein